MRKLLVSSLVVGLVFAGSAIATAHPSNVDHSDEAFIDGGEFVSGDISFDCVAGEAGEISIRVVQGGTKAAAKISYTCPSGGVLSLSDYVISAAYGTFSPGSARALVIAESLDGGKAVGKEMITLI